MCEVVSDFLNLVFLVGSPDSQAFWNTTVKPSLERFFCYQHPASSGPLQDFVSMTLLMGKLHKDLFEFTNEGEVVRILMLVSKTGVLFSEADESVLPVADALIILGIEASTSSQIYIK
jgi:hypothetical protein